MEILRTELEELIREIPLAEEEVLREQLADLISVYPFNEFEFIIGNLLGRGILTLDGYIEMRDSYIQRNMFLYIYEIAGPRTFGEQWAQGHLLGLVPKLVKPSKRLDPNYSGQYDFYLDTEDLRHIKIEVKASRAVDFTSRDQLVVKALSTFQLDKRFDMNFQQIKPACCDVFVWIGVWRDQIKYWVLSSDEVRDSAYFSIGQHRGCLLYTSPSPRDGL